MKRSDPYHFNFGDVFGRWKIDLEDGKTSAQRCLILLQLCQLQLDARNDLERLLTRDVTRKRTVSMELIEKSRDLSLELFTR